MNAHMEKVTLSGEELEAVIEAARTAELTAKGYRPIDTTETAAPGRP